LEIGRGPEIQREESWIQRVKQAESEGRSRDGSGKLRILSGKGDMKALSMTSRPLLDSKKASRKFLDGRNP
jgi:hypothetical protein